MPMDRSVRPIEYAIPIYIVPIAIGRTITLLQSVLTQSIACEYVAK